MSVIAKIACMTFAQSILKTSFPKFFSSLLQIEE
jgi:hypothetical protein